MHIYLIGPQPKTLEELREIFAHEEIVFLETVEDYRAVVEARKPKPVLRGKRPTQVIVDDLMLPTRAARFLAMDTGSLELRVLVAAQAGQHILLDSPRIDIDALIKQVEDRWRPEPTCADNYDRRQRRSKGERKANRRYRWSGS